MQDVSPMSQLVMVELLRAVIGGVHVDTIYPRDAPEKLVVVQRTGGGHANPITDSALFAVQCYAPTELEAEELAGVVWHTLLRKQWAGLRVEGRMVRGWKPAGAPVRFLNPDTPGVARFQFSGQLLVSTLKK